VSAKATAIVEQENKTTIVEQEQEQSMRTNRTAQRLMKKGIAFALQTEFMRPGDSDASPEVKKRRTPNGLHTPAPLESHHELMQSLAFGGIRTKIWFSTLLGCPYIFNGKSAHRD
jgi:hypothetical protein